MSPLSQEQCTACRSDAPAVAENEREQLKSEIPEYTIVTRDDIPRLERVYTFPDFVSALDFTNRVGEIAEEAGHHPALLTEWGKVTVSWWTHKIRNLHRNDFVMAARTDEVYRKAAPGR